VTSSRALAACAGQSPARVRLRRWEAFCWSSEQRRCTRKYLPTAKHCSSRCVRFGSSLSSHLCSPMLMCACLRVHPVALAIADMRRSQSRALCASQPDSLCCCGLRSACRVLGTPPTCSACVRLADERGETSFCRPAQTSACFSIVAGVGCVSSPLLVCAKPSQQHRLTVLVAAVVTRFHYTEVRTDHFLHASFRLINHALCTSLRVLHL
jgi:hypothetical protein